MKRVLWFFVFAVCCAPVLAGIADDGLIEDGEYDYGAIDWFSYDPPLIVDGGGANWLEIRSNGRIEVRSTSIPNGSWTFGGIRDLVIDDESHLLYLGGQTLTLTTDESATAVLKGGKIYSISSLQNTTTKHIDLYCQSGWSWQYDDEDLDGIDEVVGITGLWENDTPFDIEFINDYTFGHDPVYMNINVIEIPEPATPVLLGIGALMLKKRKKTGRFLSVCRRNEALASRQT